MSSIKRQLERTVRICILSTPLTFPINNLEGVAIAKHDGKAAVFSVTARTAYFILNVSRGPKSDKQTRTLTPTGDGRIRCLSQYSTFARAPLAMTTVLPSTEHSDKLAGAFPSPLTFLSCNSPSRSANVTMFPSARPARRCGRKSGSFARAPVPKLCRRMERGRAGRVTSQIGFRYDSGESSERMAILFEPQNETAIEVA